jgi:hypothetical protein
MMRLSKAQLFVLMVNREEIWEDLVNFRIETLILKVAIHTPRLASRIIEGED